VNLEEIHIEIAKPGSGLPRSDARETGKLHVSDVIRYIMSVSGMTKGATEWEHDPLTLAGELGFMWEDILGWAYADRAGIRPGEFEKDGLVGSPDGLGESVAHAIAAGKLSSVPEPGALADYEYKCTWKSVRNSPDDNWYWMTQFKAYAHMIDTNVVILFALYLFGDWKGHGPIDKQFRIEYSNRELKENWSMLLKHAEIMRSKGIWSYADYLLTKEK
jgi:hypothetical protein